MYKNNVRKQEPERRGIDTKQRDRGDHIARRVLKIPKIKTDNETQMEPKIRTDDRGDAGKAPLQVKKPAEPVKTRMADSKYMTPYGIRLSEKNIRKINAKMLKKIKPLDIETRRKLYHMYTFKLDKNEGSDNNLNEEAAKTDLTKNVSETRRQSQVNSAQGAKIIPDVKTIEVQTEVLLTPASLEKKNSPPTPKNQKTVVVRHKRKPIIKTLTDKKGDNTKIYKTVSFVDQKKKSPLKINIDNKSPRTPSSLSHKSKPKSISQESTSSNLPITKRIKHKSSPCSINKLSMNRKLKNTCRRKRHTSPETPATPPPLTEVAKWAPQSVNEHTKPYYEAWVNTTLAAISSDSDKMNKEKQKIIQQMQERLEYKSVFGLSEEELSDVKYTGKIKVNRKGR